uniref:B30.2/SPRY domain-containing protein n=1 Tax=Poecilia reticulata TaxID=8081 RepID=A0A3P9ND89_POERE
MNRFPQSELIPGSQEIIHSKNASVELTPISVYMCLSQQLDHLLLTETNLQFLQDVKTSDLTEFSVHQPSYGKTVMASVDKLKEMLDEEMKRFLSKAKLIRMQQFAVDVTLDPDTAHPNLVLSPDRKQVHCGGMKQNLPNNPERFDTSANVLGRQSFSSGRVYFEAEVRGKTAWDVGVVYGSIGRKGSISTDNGFWTIWLRDKVYEALAKPAVVLPLKSRLQKVGIFVDYDKGLVSFYNVDTADLIYSYKKCSFKKKLLLYINTSSNKNGRNSAPMIITPVVKCLAQRHNNMW